MFTKGNTLKRGSENFFKNGGLAKRGDVWFFFLLFWMQSWYSYTLSSQTWIHRKFKLIINVSFLPWFLPLFSNVGFGVSSVSWLVKLVKKLQYIKGFSGAWAKFQKKENFRKWGSDIKRGIRLLCPLWSTKHAPSKWTKNEVFKVLTKI